MAIESGDSKRKLKQFKNNLKNTLGSSIRKPVSVKLGFRNEEGQVFLEVASEDANQPRQFYFSSAGGQSFVGQAYLQDGAIPANKLRFGTPIRIRQDPINDEWEIIGLDILYASEFFANVTDENVEIIPLSRFEPGLLTSTIPQSMRARVLAGAYDVGSTFVYYDSQNTIDWSVTPNDAQVPAEGLARFVLVQLDPSNGTLDYKYGDPVTASLDFIQAYRFQVNNNIDFILPGKDQDKFRVGYIKLSGGMTEIDRRENIWSIQQILGAANSDADLASTLFPRIVTDGEDVVVADGEIVWID